MIYSFRHPISKQRRDALKTLDSKVRAHHQVDGTVEYRKPREPRAIGAVHIDTNGLVSIWTGDSWMKVHETADQLVPKLQRAKYSDRIALIGSPNVSVFQDQDMKYEPMKTIEASTLLKTLHDALAKGGLKQGNV